MVGEQNNPMNLFEIFELIKDLKKDISTVINTLSRAHLADLRGDVKKLIAIGEVATKPENIRTFKKFVVELERLNNNLESLRQDMADIKENMKALDGIIRALKGG